MSNEIKEIKFDHFKDLEELKQNVENWIATDEMYWERWFGLYDIKTLLDYITNLQEENKEFKARWKDTNVIIKNDKTLIMNTNAYNCLEDYKSRVEKALDKIQYIIDYGFDYDGLNNVEDLKGLIDMLVNYARESKDILRGKGNES